MYVPGLKPADGRARYPDAKEGGATPESAALALPSWWSARRSSIASAPIPVNMRRGVAVVRPYVADVSLNRLWHLPRSI